MTQPNQGNQKKKCRHTKAFHFQTKIFILNNKPYQLQSCVHPVFPEQSLFQSCTHTSWTSSPDHKTPDFLCLIKIGCVNITLKIALNQRLTTFQRKKKIQNYPQLFARKCSRCDLVKMLRSIKDWQRFKAKKSFDLDLDPFFGGDLKRILI